MITLKTLPEATAQEVYNQVKTHLLSQKQKSIDGDGCVYRGPGGLKCGAGILIGDDEYIHDMEENTWDLLVAKGVVPDTHQGLIRSLQLVHDMCPVEDWVSKLKSVAVRYNLEP